MHTLLSATVYFLHIKRGPAQSRTVEGLHTCKASDSIRERIGLMPEPVQKIKSVGKVSGGHLSMGKPLPMTGLASISLPATVHLNCLYVTFAPLMGLFCALTQRARSWACG